MNEIFYSFFPIKSLRSCVSLACFDLDWPRFRDSAGTCGFWLWLTQTSLHRARSLESDHSA